MPSPSLRRPVRNMASTSASGMATLVTFVASASVKQIAPHVG